LGCGGGVAAEADLRTAFQNSWPIFSSPRQPSFQGGFEFFRVSAIPDPAPKRTASFPIQDEKLPDIPTALLTRLEKTRKNLLTTYA
jgi:hypothetical protein